MFPGSKGPDSSSELVKQFPAPSIVPDRKKTVMFTVPKDTRMLSGLVGMANYLHSLVTKEDKVKMNEVDVLSLFNEA